MKLGINIDHIATLRNARTDNFPNILHYLQIVSKKAQFVTIHLREDKRHITNADAEAICQTHKKCFVNFELGLSEEIVSTALSLSPDAVCIVPEKRMELTTESGLNILNEQVFLQTQAAIALFKQKGIRTSLFLDPNPQNLQKLQILKPKAVEIHTGKFCQYFDENLNKIDPNFYNSPKTTNELYNFFQNQKENLLSGNCLAELKNIANFAKLLQEQQIEVHAGHGLKYLSLIPLLQVNQTTPISEVSIGHFVIAQSILEGFETVVEKFCNIRPIP